MAKIRKIMHKFQLERKTVEFAKNCWSDRVRFLLFQDSHYILDPKFADLQAFQAKISTFSSTIRKDF